MTRTDAMPDALPDALLPGPEKVLNLPVNDAGLVANGGKAYAMATAGCNVPCTNRPWSWLVTWIAALRVRMARTVSLAMLSLPSVRNSITAPPPTAVRAPVGVRTVRKGIGVKGPQTPMSVVVAAEPPPAKTSGALGVLGVLGVLGDISKTEKNLILLWTMHRAKRCVLFLPAHVAVRITVAVVEDGTLLI